MNRRHVTNSKRALKFTCAKRPTRNTVLDESVCHV